MIMTSNIKTLYRRETSGDTDQKAKTLLDLIEQPLVPWKLRENQDTTVVSLFKSNRKEV